MTYDDKFFDWIRAHAGQDPAALRLKYHGRTDMDYDAAILQIECRRKFGTKLRDTLDADPHFIFPSVLAGEQSTSDLLAEYHASIVASDLPAVDLTAGLGIDAFHISRRASQVAAVEIDEARADAIEYNAGQLHIDTLTVHHGDCVSFIKESIATGRHFTTAFIDPARRSATGDRVYALEDCTPDVLSLMPELEKLCDILIIKASPMLDIAHTISVLPHRPFAVQAVGTPTECRELLVIVNFKEETAATLIEAVTLTADDSTTYAFTRSNEEDEPMPQAAPIAADDYICEPWPTVMKTGAFRTLAAKYHLKMFNPNTRLLHSSDFPSAFPGDVYKVIEVLPYASKVIKRFKSRYPRINVAARNFGISADALRAKLAVNDGGDLRLYGITDAKGDKQLIVCRLAKTKD
ncbi:MAG: class I SAM-dependent methyltransferase [Muribaculaceae bacterium]|nr:class I SAM-dependent methyltransferase [Muribaculaceae bacterium]